MIAVACLVLLAITNPGTDGRSQSSLADSLRIAHDELFRIGEIRRAAALVERELALRLPARGADTAAALHSQGVYAAEAGNFALADSVLARALEIRRELSGDASPPVAETLLARIPGLLFWSRKEQIREFAQKAFDIYQGEFGEQHARTARAMYWLAIAESGVGASERADSLLSRALAIQRATLGSPHPEIAETLLAQSVRANAEGDLVRAARHARAGLDMMREALGPRHLRVADALYQAAWIRGEMGELQDAVDLHEEERRIRSDALGPNYELIRCRLVLAARYRALGNEQRAVELGGSNADDHRALYGEDHGWLMLRLNLSISLIHVGQLEEARQIIDDVEGRAATLDAAGVNVDHIVNTILHRRRILSLHAGEYETAETIALESLERIRRSAPNSTKWNVILYENLAMSRVGRGDLAGAEAYLDQAVEAFEFAREKVGSGVQAATFKDTPYEARAAVRLERGRFEAAWRDLERARARVLGDRLSEEGIPPPIERIQATLAPDEAIVGWLDHALLPGDNRRWGFVLRDRGSVRWTRLKSTDSKALADFRRQATSLGEALFVSGETPFAEPPARRVWADRLAPLSGQLEGVTSLVFVLSQALAGLPLDALMDEDGRFLGERYATRIAPSCAVHAWMEERAVDDPARQFTHALLVGDPAFREEHLADPALAGSAVSRSDGAVLRNAVRGDRLATHNLPRLPWSRSEVESISAIFPESTVLVGAEASARSLRSLAADGSLRRFDVLHIATHALVDPTRPGRSALVLSPLDAPDETSVVEAREIERDWSLDAEIVVLSACETAVGRQVYGEGTVGFAHSLFPAGARSLIASLWPVNDVATAMLMDRFYRLWLGCEDLGLEATSKAKALRMAKLWLRDWEDAAGRRPYAHPFYWAAFVLVGS